MLCFYYSMHSCRESVNHIITMANPGYTEQVLHHQQLSICKHPHIVEFYEVFLTPRYLGIVMEYIDGLDLQAYVIKQGGCLTEDVARFVFQQVRTNVVSSSSLHDIRYTYLLLDVSVPSNYRYLFYVHSLIYFQLVIAVDFCHRKGKVNRDIKLANVSIGLLIYGYQELLVHTFIGSTNYINNIGTTLSINLKLLSP